MTVQTTDTVTPVGPALTNPGQPTTDQSSARAIIDAWFAQTGIAGLTDTAWQMLLSGDSPEQIVNWARTTPQYAARYPAMAGLNKSGRGISEAQYQNYEQSIYQMAQSAGLPKGMYDSPDQIAKMMLNDVSVSEAKSRYDLAVQASNTAPQSVRDQMQQLYGTRSGDIVGLYLDSGKALPQLQRQFAAAQVAGAAQDQGIRVDQGTAETLAAQGLDYSQSLAGFGQVAATAALGAGQGEVANQAQRIAAQFGNTAAQTATTRVVKGRLAQFNQGGTPSTAAAGLKGLGTTSA